MDKDNFGKNKKIITWKNTAIIHNVFLKNFIKLNS